MKRIVSLLVAALLMIESGQQTCAQTRIGEHGVLPACQYLNTELDGSVTVRSYGEGKRRLDAREQARKNAVYAIVFKGIQAEGQPIRPLVTEANGYERHEAYWAEFFADGGIYKQYATGKDEKLSAKERNRGKVQNIHGSIVRVLRGQLKTRLIKDGIIKE